MMKTNKVILLVCMTLTLAYCGSSPQQTQKGAKDLPLNDQWAMDDLWNDGQAEVATYAAERVVYGKPRQFDYTYVLVKETFNKEYRVKTDDYDRSDLYEVMKINKFCRIPTLVYPYHYLTSVFMKRDNTSQVHKLTNTSQEWCGNTAKSFLEKENKYLFEYMSYWDGEGNGSAKIGKGPWFEDQLSYSLRTLNFQEGLSFNKALYPSQINSQADIPEAETATFLIKKADPSSLDSIAKNYAKEAWEVEVKRTEGPSMTYWFGVKYPNYLLKMESSDGRKLALKSITRDAYWTHE